MSLKQYKYLGYALFCLFGFIVSILTSIDLFSTEMNFDTFIGVLKVFFFFVYFIYFSLKFKKQLLEAGEKQ